MESRLHSRRTDVKLRRRTLRQSILDERRQTGILTNESTPDTDANPEPRLRTRRAIRALEVRSEAAQKLEERKARKAITAKEVQKARPPFNNYIRVKHTGLSPFRSYQDASKRSKVAPWRAPPPKSQAPVGSTAGPEKKTAPPHHQPVQLATSKYTSRKLPVPNITVAPGVVQFGVKPHGTAKAAFKPPAKIEPMPFPTRATKAQVTKTDPKKEKKKIPPKNIPVKRFSPKHLTKNSPKGQFIKKPVVPKILARQPVQVVQELAEQPPKTTRHTIIKPRGMKKQLNEMARNLESKQLPMRVSRRNVEPSTRVLRSSRASFLQHNKENELPLSSTTVMAKVSKRMTKNAAGPSNVHALVVETPEEMANDRTKRLEERSARLTNETDRLRSQAEEWSLLKLTPSLPANIAEDIDSVTGQTMLLISKKFVQFKGLIEGAYTDLRTTLEDLDGFWEMMYIQVKQLDAKYEDLNAMREKNWNANSPKLFKNVQIREKKRSKPAKKLSVGKSNFHKFLAEKLKKEAESTGGPPSEPLKDVQSETARQCSPTMESPLLSMSVVEDFETPLHSFNFSQRSGTPRSTPRMLENVQRASRSSRFSNTMMRLSSIFQDGPTT